MSSTTLEQDLKELERRAFRSTFQDGLWDIYLGLFLLCMNLGFVFVEAGISKIGALTLMAILATVLIVSFRAGKTFITIPRLGRVNFGEERKARLKKTQVGLFISVFAGIAVFIVVLAMLTQNYRDDAPVLILAAIYAINMILVFSLMAYNMDYNRLYIIGALYALPFPLVVGMDVFADVDLQFFTVGALSAGIIIAMGFYHLVQLS